MQTLQWNYTELFSFSEAQLFLYIDFSIFNEARQNVTFRFFESSDCIVVATKSFLITCCAFFLAHLG